MSVIVKLKGQESNHDSKRAVLSAMLASSCMARHRDHAPCVLNTNCGPWATTLPPFWPLAALLLLLDGCPSVGSSASSISERSLSESEVSEPDMLDTCRNRAHRNAVTVTHADTIPAGDCTCVVFVIDIRKIDMREIIQSQRCQSQICWTPAGAR